MQGTYRVQVARIGWAALVAALVLLALPGTSIAASASVGSAPIFEAGGEPLARGAGYGLPDDARRVRTLQRTLRRLGWSPGPIDGLFGPRTEAAVVRFQRAAGLMTDGVVGARTFRALRTAKPRPLKPAAGYGQPEGSTRVRSLQRRLRGLGLRPGPVDGRFGPRTQAAVIRLQAAAGAPLSGVVDAGTRRLLADADQILRQDRRRAGGRGKAPNATRPGQQDNRRTAPRNTPEPQPTADGGESRAEEGGESTDISIPLLLAAVALAGLAGALLARVGSNPAGTSVPLAHGIVAEGRARDGSIGEFRGRVHALVLGTRGLLRRPEARYLVSDPQKPGPFWVTHAEIDKLVAPKSTGVRPGAGGHGNGNGNGAGAETVRVVGYATVPKTEQPGGPLVREQAAAINTFCEQRDWQLLELVRDVEEPRVKGLDRPGLTYALERVARGEASCLVVSQLRRLSPSASDLGRILESIAAGGGRLVAMDVDVDTAAPAGRKAANVLISVGAWERERVGARTRKGLEAARAKGNRVGRPGVDDVPELKERITAMRASGMTLQAIADRLNDEGVPTLRGGEKWRPSSVQAAVGYRRPPRRWQNGGGSKPEGGREAS
jgi:peptidoglycan hydrolase-like protein with peptidoglycan-binding domain/DNA invertase Pin-like site-specific DNA recombinase